jgi:hypothetical protein
MHRSLVAVTFALIAMATAHAGPNASAIVPGAQDHAGRRVLTFIAKDPPGVRCNGNVQVAAEIVNTYRVPIQLLPSSLAPGLPAPAVLYGDQLIAADGKDFNGAASFEIVSDVLELEGVERHGQQGLLNNPGVRDEFDALKASIKAGGR